MTMQNPDKPILAKDLNDYHNKILPYLGGMPEVLANKFAKGDLYDTNERMIGKWINGKPLYQKVFTGLDIELQWLSEKYAYTIISPLISGIDMIISCIGVRESNNPSSLSVPLSIKIESSTQWNIQSIADYSVKIIILQYTKTSDSANSFNIGSDTDYSTEEKIVGTWIDGSYIYQKTYTGLDIQLLYNDWVNVVQIQNIKKIINFELYSTTSSEDTLNITGAGVEVSVSNSGYIRVESTQNASLRKIKEFTVQYTKTSS